MSFLKIYSFMSEFLLFHCAFACNNVLFCDSKYTCRSLIWSVLKCKASEVSVSVFLIISHLQGCHGCYTLDRKQASDRISNILVTYLIFFSLTIQLYCGSLLLWQFIIIISWNRDRLHPYLFNSLFANQNFYYDSCVW